MVLTFSILLEIALAFLAHVLVASPVPLERRGMSEHTEHEEPEVTSTGLTHYISN